MKTVRFPHAPGVGANCREVAAVHQHQLGKRADEKANGERGLLDDVGLCNRDAWVIDLYVRRGQQLGQAVAYG